MRPGEARGAIRQRTCRLIAIDAWHHHIHEDEIRLHLLGLLYALGAIGGCSGLKAVTLQRNLHDVHFGGRVIHYQYERHAGASGLQTGHLPTWVSIAFNSSSFVKGLVR